MPVSRVLKGKPVEANVWDLAVERTRRVFDEFDHVAVSFSGGKDSTAVFHLAYDEARRRSQRLRVIFSDEEAIPYETVDYVRRVSQLPGVDMEWLCIPVKHVNSCAPESPFWYPWDPDLTEKWVRPLPPEAITEVEGFKAQPASARWTFPDTNGLLFPPELGRCAVIMGIKADESLTRRRAVSRRTHDNWLNLDHGLGAKGNVTKAYTIYDWRDPDIWRAPKVNGWDYNRAYDALAMAGLPTRAQRVAPPFGEQPMRALWTFQVCFPDVWDRMADRVPGAAAAARYATGELYSFNGQAPPKPAGVKWSEWVLHFLDKHQPEQRAAMAKRMQTEIRLHFKHTADPILAYAPHPVTGLSWSFLAKLAHRGDYKNRTWASMVSKRNQEAWDAELAQAEANGTIGEMR